MRPRASLLLTTLAALLASSHSRAENAEAASARRAENPSPASLPVLPAESIRLSNGLRVLLAPDAGARLVSIVVSYAAGAADDPNGLNGLAHLTEHFAARRTAHIELPSQVLERAGAWRFNAITSEDTTNYFETLPPEHLETALWLESDRMAYAATDKDDQTLLEEREVVRNENRDRTVDGMLASAAVATHEALYPGWHPYAAAADGATDLDRIHVADVRAFLRTWYSPENATLAIAGRFDRDKTVALVKRYFESLPTVSPPVRPVLPASSTPGVLLGVRAPTSGDQVTLDWRTPAYGERDDAALDLVASILAGADNDRLARALIAKHLATSVYARQRSMRRESVFVVTANVAPGVNAGLVADTIQDVVDGLARDVAPTEIDRARRSWRNATHAQMETTWGRADSLVSLADAGLEPGAGFDWGYGRYESIGEADIKNAAAKWLALTHRVGVVVLMEKGAPRRGSLVIRQEVGE